ncbi:Fic family protein [Hoeflea alexandrii]|uniref:Fic family protein n=1 Tax=Hoeflea alexandrii TaxID=288436 RepID=UPI0022B04DD2|nr:Fic family protein [Hoeflea alexandrii]MCZ4288596.1 Fic family protein [Hoeflea alexandrii]
MPSTETALREWRYGPTQAERLVVGILRLEKYNNVHPQAPLGGPDNGADILCDRGRYFWVCAVYFPTTEKEFSAIERKFLHDLESAQVHGRNGFIFMTNQRLTRQQRNDLRDQANALRQECEIYDVERIRGALDSPEGYGLRVGYLHIAMNADEQVAFFANRENQLADLMTEQTQHLKVVLSHIDQIRQGQADAAQTMRVMAGAQDLSIDPVRSMDPLAVGEILSEPGVVKISLQLDPAMVLLFHRLVCFDLPSRIVGHLRTEEVVIRKASAAPADPTISPPKPADIRRLLTEVCTEWRTGIAAAKNPIEQMDAIVRLFHGILSVHPFLDGNGRVARSILMQQCLDTFGHVDMSRLDRGVPYYTSLQAADGGEFAPLKALILKAVSG